jgi:hypothetical protein
VSEKQTAIPVPGQPPANPAAQAESNFHLLDALSGNLKDAEKGISRNLILITTLSAFFVILARDQAGPLVISGIPITNHYFVQAFLPVVIAALYLSMVNSMQMAIELISAQDHLVRVLGMDTARKNGERLLWPSTGAFAALAALPVLLHSASARRTTQIGSWMRYLLYTTAPIGVVVYSVWFLLSHNPGPLQWTAVTVSLIIIVQPIILLRSIIPSIVNLSSTGRERSRGAVRAG